MLIADDDWIAIRAARMDGLATYFGNPVSEHADVHMDLTGIGTLVAASSRREINTLSCVRFGPEFGEKQVFRIRILGPGEAPKQSVSGALRGTVLFGETVTQRLLEERLEQGYSIRATRLTEEFAWKDYRAKQPEDSLPLCAIDEEGAVRLSLDAEKFAAKPGWVVLALSKRQQEAVTQGAPADPGTNGLAPLNEQEEAARA